LHHFLTDQVKDEIKLRRLRIRTLQEKKEYSKKCGSCSFM